MAINSNSSTGSAFDRTFGRTNRQPAQPSTDLPKAKIWINIGYVAPNTAGDDGKDKFVALPMGLPLDTMERCSTRGSNVSWNQFQAARNALFDQLMQQANKLQPGEDYILNIEGSHLAIQIRRINEELPEAGVGADNPFMLADLFAA